MSRAGASLLSGGVCGRISLYGVYMGYGIWNMELCFGMCVLGGGPRVSRGRGYSNYF